jgi:YebC/PmpR family DNA-binding regulatory protein
MSGHSKWATIKHKKGAADKNRDSSVPLDTIERAIKRGTGELEGVNYEPITYEGYAPAGVALYVEVLTDNRNRSSSDMRSIFSKNGGSMAEPGAVAWQFERKGIITLDRALDEDELMMVALEHGGEDLVDEGDTWRLTCEPTDLNGLREALETNEVAFENADLTMLPTSTVEVADVSDAKAILRLIDALDDNDDVQDVFANFDMPDEILQAAAAEE